MATSGCQRTAFLACIYLFIFIYPITCWDTDDLELFDLVEEVNGNFYELLGVSKTATSSEVKKAYRKKTVVLHPDKNKAPDAEEQFRKLVAVYETLKDDEKREKYNLVLENGLPDWRQPVFYYRKARKMGLVELFAVLCIIVTIGQYFVLWAVYLERRLALEDFFESKKKREKKGKRKAAAINDQLEEDMQETLDSIPRPSLRKLWPITLSIWLVKSIVNMPTYMREWKERKKEEKEMKILEEFEKKEIEKQEALMREEQELRKQKRKIKPERKFAPVVMADGTPVLYGQGNQSSSEEEDESLKQTTKGGSWTDEDFVILSKAYIRFPGGTTNRWEKIAEMVGRPVSEVTAKCKQMKGNFTMNLSASVQAGTKQSKNTVEISDRIISTLEPEVVGMLTKNGEETGTKLRKRVKNSNDPQRTSMISQTQQNGTTSGIEKSSENQSGAIISSQKKENKTVMKTVNQWKDNSSAGDKIAVESHEAKLEKKTVSQIPTRLKSVPKKDDNKKLDANVEDADNWSQDQQMILEKALRQYPKGTDQRWEKIAEHIPGKTKEHCITRFKHLAELVKQKKQQS